MRVMFHLVFDDDRVRPCSELLFISQSFTCLHPLLASCSPNSSFHTCFTHWHPNIKCSEDSHWSHIGHVAGTYNPHLANPSRTASALEVSFQANTLTLGRVFAFQMASHRFCLFSSPPPCCGRWTPCPIVVTVYGDTPIWPYMGIESSDCRIHTTHYLQIYFSHLI